MSDGLPRRWTIAPTTEDNEPLVERLRELSLVEVGPLAGDPADPALVEAFREDLQRAVTDAERAVAQLLATPTAANPDGLRLRADKLAEASRLQRLAARVLARLNELA